MRLKLNEPVHIEDLRRHSPQEVRRLRNVLVRGANARQDSNRDNFYEVEDGARIFYIHISPRGNVLLLAVWLNDGLPFSASAGVPLTHSAAV
ncbi:MAG: hypothetical protein ACRD3D_04550 [Terriglobia bacterium]